MIKVSVAGPWSVRVTSNVFSSSGITIRTVTPVELFIVPSVTVAVKNEEYEDPPQFQPDKSPWNWLKGVRLRGVLTQETTAKGMLEPGSLRLKSGPDPDAEDYVLNSDYALDPEWGTFGRLTESRIKEGQTVYADYTYGKSRIDTVVLNRSGKISLRQGEPHVAVPIPPSLKKHETAIANIWIPGRLPALTPAHIFLITETTYSEKPKEDLSVAEQLLPKTLLKLRNGGTLKILAWGDSVTVGEYLGDLTKRWQDQFVNRLKIRFPKAKIKLITLGWGGHNTSDFLSEHSDSPYHYQEKVLGAKPDLVVSEFVNDSVLGVSQVEGRYGKFLADFRKINTEWIILTPHYVRPDWMGLEKEQNIDDDPREYVLGLRRFAAKARVPLADASLRWGRLWRQGIPYTTLLLNAINHPDERGMKLFADSLMALFPDT